MSTDIEELTFQVNDYITLKLEDGKTRIYIKGELFRFYCKPFLVAFPKDQVEQLEDAESLEDAAKMAKEKLGLYENVSREQFQKDIMGEIGPETEFWGHCSNMQAWVDNQYSTTVMMSNLAFPLLKELSMRGDPIAKRKYKDEIIRRFTSGQPTVINFLVRGGYMNEFSYDELVELFGDIRGDSIPIPNEEVAWGLIGGLFVNKKDYDNGILCLKRSLEINPECGKTLGALSIAHILMKNYDVARAMLDGAPESTMKMHYLWYARGRLYEKTGDIPSAKNSYKSAIDIKETMHTSWHRLGHIYRDEKNYDEAIRMFEKAREINDSVTYIIDIGSTHFYKKSYDDALLFFFLALENVTSDDARDPVSNAILKVYAEANRYNDMIEFASNTLLKNSQDPTKALKFVLTTVSSLDAASDIDLDKLIYICKELLNLDVDAKLHKDTLEYLGTLYYMKGDLVSAEKHFLECVNKYPESKMGAEVLSSIYGRVGGDEGALKALKVMNTYISLRPEDAFGWERIGTIYTAMGNIEEAIKSVDSALQISPDNPKSLLLMGRLYTNEQEYKKALKYIKRSVEIDPTSADAWSLMGRMHLHKKEYKKAVISYKKSLGIDPEQRVEWINLGYCYYRLGELDNVLECITQSFKYIAEVTDAEDSWANLVKKLTKRKMYDWIPVVCDRVLKSVPDSAKFIKLKKSKAARRGVSSS